MEAMSNFCKPTMSCSLGVSFGLESRQYHDSSKDIAQSEYSYPPPSQCLRMKIKIKLVLQTTNILEMGRFNMLLTSSLYLAHIPNFYKSSLFL